MTEMIRPTPNLKDLTQSEFGTLLESHQKELRAHCYRMLGSVQEAEEMVQEAFWRAWDRRETYEGRSTIRAWLYRITTNLCIDTPQAKTAAWFTHYTAIRFNPGRTYPGLY